MALYNLKNPYDREKFKEKCRELYINQSYVELKKKDYSAVFGSEQLSPSTVRLLCVRIRLHTRRGEV